MRLVLLAAAILALAPPAAARTSPPFDPAGWVADLHQVREAMSSHYANLEWAVVEREAPLGPLFAMAEQRLSAARNEAEAREVFNRFESYLGDGHVDFVWPSNASAGAPANATEPGTPCERLGFRTDRDGGALATRLPGYRPLEGDSGFDAGTIEVEGAVVGVLRIGQFTPQVHPAACAAALAELRSTNAPCDDACEERLWTLAADRVTRDLSERLRALEAAGAEVLLVDIAGNGGGTEWVEAVARVVTPVRLRSARVGFIRHPHWVEGLAESEQRMAAAAEGEPPEDRARLAGYQAVFAEARRQAETPCDPAPLWRGERADCAWLGSTEMFSSGPVAELDPDLIGKPWASEVFTPLKFAFEPGVWSGPLVVLVDGATASASEEFAAMLQDNRAAVILGSPTRGAGCGHTRGGVVTVLNHSGATLRLPDCARFRADGTNEVSGIDPDVLIGFRENDGGRRRVGRLTAALPSAIARARAQAAERDRAARRS
jgi:hypothetical protein